MGVKREHVYLLVKAHVERLGLPSSPKEPSEQFGDAVSCWEDAFNDVNANIQEASKASRRVARNPPEFWREQLPAVLAAIDAERISNFAQPVEGASSAGFTGDRETAMAASAGCQTCDGSGMAMVFHRQYQGRPDLLIEQPDGSKRRVMGRFMLHCHCDYGRWMQARVKATDAPLAARMDGIAAVMDGRSRYVAFDPTRMDEADIRSTVDVRRLRNSLPVATRSPY